MLEISPQGPIINCIFDDSVGDLLGLTARTFFEEYTSSKNPDDILSFDIIFIETDIAKG